MNTQETVFTEDTQNKTLTILRHFDAPPDRVWQAWTVSEILDQWWAPHPFKAVTKKMDFRVGGQWLYAMVGPGATHWSRADFTAIQPRSSIANTSAFCDEAGNKNPDMPQMDWKIEFAPSGDETAVKVVLSFTSEADLKMIITMGFKQGFTAGLDNLKHYLATRETA